MAYLGSKPSSGFITTAKQRITSSTNNYVDLDNAISSLADVIVWVNFVKQSYTNLTLTSSSRITLGATLVASDIVEIAYLGKAVATQNPSTNSVTNDMLSGSIANSKLATDPLNASNLASGTVPTARLGSGTASSSTFLRGDGSWQSAGGDNTPSFQAYGNTSYQAVADGTYTTVEMPNELYDTSSAYSTSTYKFTPQTSGKYFLWGHAMGDGNWNTTMFLVIQKNQSFTAGDFWRSNGYVTANGGVTCSGVLTANGSSDYFELRVYQGSGGSYNLRNQPSEIQFGGFKIIE